MDKQDIAARLFHAAEERARKSTLRLGNGAQISIRGMAEQAAEKILLASGTTGVPPDAQVKAAEIIFAQLVARMIAERRRIKDYRIRNPESVGEETLARALAALCPIWPLC